MINIRSVPGAFTLSAFVGAVILGGGNFLAVRFSNGELPPFWGAALRFALAGILFTSIAVGLRLEWPKGRRLLMTAIYGLFTFTLSYALMYWALVTITAGTAAVVLALVPLVTTLLAAAQRLERLSRRAVLGAVVALGGIVWMTVDPEGFVVPTAGLLAVLAASLTIGQSVILGKRISNNHPVMTNAVGMAVGAPLLMLISLIAGEQWSIPTRPETILSLSYLVLGGSIGLFVLMLLVVRRWTASVTSYSFVLFPVVTMLAEAWIIDEPLTARGLVGAAVVMGAVWLGTVKPKTRERDFGAAETSPATAR